MLLDKFKKIEEKKFVDKYNIVYKKKLKKYNRLKRNYLFIIRIFNFVINNSI